MCTPAGPARCAFETAPVAFPRPEGVRGNAPSPARTRRTAAPKAVHDCGLGRIGLFSETYNHLRLDLVTVSQDTGTPLSSPWASHRSLGPPASQKLNRPAWSRRRWTGELPLLQLHVFRSVCRTGPYMYLALDASKTSSRTGTARTTDCGRQVFEGRGRAAISSTFIAIGHAASMLAVAGRECRRAAAS